MRRMFSAFLYGGASGVFAWTLLAYLFVGTCGQGWSGFVIAVKAGRLLVRGGWCEASLKAASPAPAPAPAQS